MKKSPNKWKQHKSRYTVKTVRWIGVKKDGSVIGKVSWFWIQAKWVPDEIGITDNRVKKLEVVIRGSIDETPNLIQIFDSIPVEFNQKLRDIDW